MTVEAPVASAAPADAPADASADDSAEPPSVPPPSAPERTRSTSVWRVLRCAEFRVLTLAQFASLAGDQLARVAVSVLVFQRSHSALLTAIAYALTFVPVLIGGPLLSGLADRHSRRRVMVGCDLARVPLIGLLALPGLPLPLALTLLGLAGLLDAPFDAARSALLPLVLSDEEYPAGLAVGQVGIQASQIGGFGLAGLLLLITSPHWLLVLDAASFAVSAGLIARYVVERPAAAEPGTGGSRRLHLPVAADVRVALRAVLVPRRVRTLALLAWSVATFAIAIEALAAPTTSASGSSRSDWSAYTGLLLAAAPAGHVLAALAITHLPTRWRERSLVPLAVLSVLPLLVGFAHPPALVLVGAAFLSGLGLAFNVLASTAFVQRVADDVRGRAFGLVQTGLLAGQGVGVLLAGALATATDPSVAVGLCGLAGAVAVVATAFDARRR